MKDAGLLSTAQIMIRNIRSIVIENFGHVFVIQENKLQYYMVSLFLNVHLSHMSLLIVTYDFSNFLNMIIFGNIYSYYMLTAGTVALEM